MKEAGRQTKLSFVLELIRKGVNKEISAWLEN